MAGDLTRIRNLTILPIRNPQFREVPWHIRKPELYPTDFATIGRETWVRNEIGLAFDVQRIRFLRFAVDGNESVLELSNGWWMMIFLDGKHPFVVTIEVPKIDFRVLLDDWSSIAGCDLEVINKLRRKICKYKVAIPPYLQVISL